jgi:hypothetical protein
MKNTKELKQRTKRELLEETKKYKKRNRFLIFLIIIVVGYLAYNFISDGFKTKNKLVDELNCEMELETYFQNQTNMSTEYFKKNLCEESSITRTINSFFDNFLELEKPWIFKFLVFLGVIYLIQVMFALVLDVLEVFMLIFVIIKRIYKWVRSKFKKKDETEKEIKN